MTSTGTREKQDVNPEVQPAHGGAAAGWRWLTDRAADTNRQEQLWYITVGLGIAVACFLTAWGLHGNGASRGLVPSPPDRAPCDLIRFTWRSQARYRHWPFHCCSTPDACPLPALRSRARLAQPSIDRTKESPAATGDSGDSHPWLGTPGVGLQNYRRM